MENNKELIKKDLMMIVKLDSKIDYSDVQVVKQYYGKIVQGNALTTAAGQKYRKKLEQIINGDAGYNTCILCNKETEKETVICQACMAKLHLRAVVYCRNCGNKMDPTNAVCPVCGKGQNEGFKYCAHCGNKVPMPDMVVDTEKVKKMRPAGEAVKTAAESAQPASSTITIAAESIQLTDGTEKPVAESVQPTDGTEKPVAESMQPTDGAEKPVAKSVQSTGSTEKPAAESEQPADGTEKFAAQNEQPADSAEKSAAQSVQSAHSAEKPVAESAQRADGADKPAAESAKTADTDGTAKPVKRKVRRVKKAKPTDSTGKSADSTEKPVDKSTKPADGKDKPAGKNAKSVDSTEKPVDKSAKPADSTIKPAGSVIKPADTEEGKAQPWYKSPLISKIIMAVAIVVAICVVGLLVAARIYARENILYWLGADSKKYASDKAGAPQVTATEQDGIMSVKLEADADRTYNLNKLHIGSDRDAMRKCMRDLKAELTYKAETDDNTVFWQYKFTYKEKEVIASFTLVEDVVKYIIITAAP